METLSVPGDFMNLFLGQKPGLDSGFMMLHVTAAALTSENKTFAYPATVDSIPTSAGQEDHVSMAPWAGNKLLSIIDNVKNIFTFELIIAAQAVDFRKPLKPNKLLYKLHSMIRNKISFLSSDKLIMDDVSKLKKDLFDGNIMNFLNKSELY